MINYVQRKKIEDQNINKLLMLSSEVNQFTNDGPVKRKLESLLHSKLNLSEEKSVVCLSNGTTACHALMYLYEKLKGRKLRWCVPSFTFPTPVVSGFRHKLVDIDEKTFTVPLENHVLDSCDGVIITNLFGTTNSIKEWEELCKKEDKILIFDNASSPLTTLFGKSICDFGDSTFGSLHHTKYLGFGEGGFAVVPKEHYHELNSISNFGFKSERIHNKLSSNFKMSEVSAAYCYSQVENYNIKRHIQIQNLLVEDFDKFGLSVFNFSKTGSVNYVLGNMPILFDNSVEVSLFRNLGVEANKYYRPLGSHKNAKKLFARMINLPLNCGLSDYELELICKIAREAKKAIDGK